MGEMDRRCRAEMGGFLIWKVGLGKGGIKGAVSKHRTPAREQDTKYSNKDILFY